MNTTQNQLLTFKKLCQQGLAGQPEPQQPKKRRPSEKLIRFVTEEGNTLFCVPSGTEISYQVGEQSFEARVFYLDAENMEIMQLFQSAIIVEQVSTSAFCKSLFQLGGKISVHSFTPPF